MANKANKKPMFWISGNLRQVQATWAGIKAKLGDPNIQVMHCGFNPDNLDGNLIRFSSASDIIMALKDRDIFDTRPRIIKLLGIPDDYTKIVDYLDCVNNENILVILGKPGYRSFGSNRWISATTSKFYKTIKSHGYVFDFPTEAKNSSDAVKWVQEVGLEHGAKFKNNIAKLLIDLKGRNLDVLTMEVSKIASYCSNNKIEEEHIRDCCSRDFQQTVWEFIENIDYKRCDECLSFLQEMYRVSPESSFYGDKVLPMLGALNQHLIFIMILKDVCPNGPHYNVMEKALSDFRKTKSSEAFKLKKGIVKADELSPWFTIPYLRRNINSSAVKEVYQWRGKDVYSALLDVKRCSLICRLNSGNVSFMRLCLDSMVLNICGKVSLETASSVRGDCVCLG